MFESNSPNSVASYRISEAFYKEDWSKVEIQSLMNDPEILKKLDWIEDSLWFPKPIELFNFLLQSKNSESLNDDIHFHLESLECLRSIRLLKLMMQDTSIKILSKLSSGRLMNIFGHLAFSKTWVVSLHNKEHPGIANGSETYFENSVQNLLPLKQLQGDSSRNIILGNFPIRMKRSMQAFGEKITLQFPTRTYPFPRVRVMAIDENYAIIMNEELFLDAGSKFWSVRFKAPVAPKFMLVVRPLDSSECVGESNSF